MPSSSRVVARLLQLAETDRVAVHDDRGAHAYAAIAAQARGLAGALLGERASLGGERVAVFVVPGADFVAALFGVWLAGGCAVVLSPLHPAAESAYFCEDARVQVVVCSPAFEAQARAFAGGRTIVAPDAAASVALPAIAASDAALQLYTSGTTGKPKGAVLTHANLATQQEILTTSWGFAPDDVLLHTLPLHHMHGLCIALLSALGAGCETRMLPKFEARAVWEAMAEATIFMAVPTMYAKLFAAFDDEGDATRARWASLARSLRLATSGSAALPVTLAAKWQALTGEIPLERFGMTEVGAAISNPLSGERRAGSVGTPLPTFAIRVVDEEQRDADSGELWISGPSVFDGYFERPEANAAAFVSHDGARWFRTGDTVVRDGDGYVRMLGRTSVDILKSGGYKLSALEIEETLREHPAVAEVAVIGVPDATWGDRVVACVVVRAGHVCDEADLRAFAKERLAPYKVPRTVLTMTELPRNAMGKVIKPALTALVPR